MTGAERLGIVARAREVADDLCGTAKSLRDFAHEAEQDDPDFCTELDERVLECERCGWWCDELEMLHDDFCDDCAGDDDDD